MASILCPLHPQRRTLRNTPGQAGVRHLHSDASPYVFISRSDGSMLWLLCVGVPFTPHILSETTPLSIINDVILRRAAPKNLVLWLGRYFSCGKRDPSLRSG